MVFDSHIPVRGQHYLLTIKKKLIQRYRIWLTERSAKVFILIVKHVLPLCWRSVPWTPSVFIWIAKRMLPLCWRVPWPSSWVVYEKNPIWFHPLDCCHLTVLYCIMYSIHNCFFNLRSYLSANCWSKLWKLILHPRRVSHGAPWQSICDPINQTRVLYENIESTMIHCQNGLFVRRLWFSSHSAMSLCYTKPLSTEHIAGHASTLKHNSVIHLN